VDFENIPFFFFNNVAVTVDGTMTNQGVVFSDNGFQHLAFGNAWFVNPEDQVIANNTFAGFFEEEQEIFSGPVGNPTFIPGTADGFDFEPDREDELAGTLDIETVAQTPEPGSFVLLGSGLLGLAGVVRRKLAISF
jgi:hypothetical protein